MQQLQQHMIIKLSLLSHHITLNQEMTTNTLHVGFFYFSSSFLEYANGTHYCENAQLLEHPQECEQNMTFDPIKDGTLGAASPKTIGV